MKSDRITVMRKNKVLTEIDGESRWEGENLETLPFLLQSVNKLLWPFY